MSTFIRIAVVACVAAAPAFAQEADLEILKARADSALADVDAKKAALDAAKAEVDAKPDDEALKTAAATAAEAYEASLDELEAAATALGEAGGRIATYNERLLEAGRARLDAEAAFNLVAKWTRMAKDWLVEKGPGVLLKILGFLGILLLFKVLANVAAGITRKGIQASRMKVSDLLKNFFVNVVHKTVFLIGLLMALSFVEAPIGPLLAGIGVAGFVVGFALQNTLANFASGVMILLYRPYDIGDVIDAGGTKGKVEAMTLVSTTLVTPDNQVVVVPNNSIWGSTITNITARATRRLDMTVGVSYGDDLDEVEKVLTEVVTSHPKVLAEPAPDIKVLALADSSVNFAVRPWVKTAQYWDVFFDLNKAIKQRLDKEGISIPFPQRDVHLYDARVEA